jgi:hypothetical protein
LNIALVAVRLPFLETFFECQTCGIDG